MVKSEKPDVSIVLPCLNEAAAIPTCITQLKELARQSPYAIEVIVVDNNSTDTSKSLLQEAQQSFSELTIVQENERGYGNAYLRGFSSARADLLVMADLDTTYTLSELSHIITALTQGYDFVLGNRFAGHMHKHAMPWHHRFIGNPLLSFLVRLFFKTSVHDVHCGMRGITRNALQRLHLRTAGMEFASEMVIRAVQKKLRIAEVAISYRPRIGTSKLRSFADGWRHMRFMLLYSPLYLFLLPGVILFMLGAISMIFLYLNKLSFLGIQFIVHPIFVSSLLMIVGHQLIAFAGFAKAYAVTHLGEESHLLEKAFRFLSIEKASLIGLTCIAFGLALYIIILVRWIDSGFGSLNEIKNAVVGLTLAVLGVQTISTAFMTSILGIKEN